MKAMILAIFAMSSMVGSMAHAGRWEFACKSADGSFLLTRDNLVIVSKSPGLPFGLTTFDNLTVNTFPNKDEVMEFSVSTGGKKSAELKILSMSKRKTIETEGSDGGTGSILETYKVKAALSVHLPLFEVDNEKVELLCEEFAGWSGHQASEEQ